MAAQDMVKRQKEIRAVLLLILGILGIGARQERDRAQDWFSDLAWGWQCVMGVVMIVAVMLVFGMLVAPFLKDFM